jgi:hypothetical protein
MEHAEAITHLQASFRQLREMGMSEKMHNHLLRLLEDLKPKGSYPLRAMDIVMCYPGVPDQWRLKPEDIQATNIIIDISKQLEKIQRSLDVAPPWALKIMRALKLEEATNLATKQTLDDLVNATSANTNATAAATDALTHFAQSNADLTAQLEAALAGADAPDDAAIEAAVAAIKANNDALLAAAPKVATAITTGTPAAS